MGPKQRKDHEKESRGFEKERVKAKDFLESHGIIPTGDALQFVRLWEEQEKQCPYCDNAISQSQLLGGNGEIDIDHIYPFSRSADNSMANKVVCHRRCNAEKKNKTPREWLKTTDPAAYEAMLQRTRIPPVEQTQALLRRGNPGRLRKPGSQRHCVDGKGRPALPRPPHGETPPCPRHQGNAHGPTARSLAAPLTSPQ